MRFIAAILVGVGVFVPAALKYSLQRRDRKRIERLFDPSTPNTQAVAFARALHLSRFGASGDDRVPILWGAANPFWRWEFTTLSFLNAALLGTLIEGAGQLLGGTALGLLQRLEVRLAILTVLIAIASLACAAAGDETRKAGSAFDRYFDPYRDGGADLATTHWHLLALFNVWLFIQLLAVTVIIIGVSSEAQHQLRETEWGLWLAVVTLLVGTCTFIDDYYLTAPQKTWVRHVVTMWLRQLAVPPDARKNVSSLAVYEIAIPVIVAVAPPILIWLVLTSPLAHGLLDRPGGQWIGVALMLGAVIWLWSSASFIMRAGAFALLAIVLVSGYLIRSIARPILGPAADPARSPIRFGASLLGLWILVAKLSLELSR